MIDSLKLSSKYTKILHRVLFKKFNITSSDSLFSPLFFIDLIVIFGECSLDKKKWNFIKINKKNN